MQVEEVTAVVSGGGDDSNELDVGPEDGVEMESNLVLDADFHVGDRRLFPVWERGIEVDCSGF